MPFQHDRPVDARPTNSRHAAAGKVLPGHVPGTIQIGVQLETAFPADKSGLSLAVAAIHEATPRASLTGVAGIDPDNLAASLLSLVF
jgi:hypothetical protein